MKMSSGFRYWQPIVSISLVTFLFLSNASARETVLHTFASRPASVPQTRLIPDGSGRLYGTTEGHPFGTVYSLDPKVPNSYRVLYQFKGGNDGYDPSSEVVFDKSGNMYGTTQLGGGSTNCGSAGCGTVYEISPKNGGWSEKVIYGFQGGNDGWAPLSGLAIDNSGNLYGTTNRGGAADAGTVFELQNSGGTWTKTTLFQFSGTDGWGTYGTLIWDAAGNLYGGTEGGGTGPCYLNGCGTIFELSPNGGGWIHKILYSFQGSPNDGFSPNSLMMDSSGNLFGTTYWGGSTNCPTGQGQGCGVV